MINYPEIYWLTLTALMTSMFYMPYITRLIVQLGPRNAALDPDGNHQLEAKWAQRAKRAHYNAVENLVVFAPLVIVVHLLGLHNETTELAVKTYFFARLGHYVVYLFGVPFIRTLLFLVSWVCQVTLALTVLGAI
ncbi:MAG: hypothetical protein FD163_236 [Hyphomonadaceae bacterium]|nr:MAG: hypothetical protein FD128_183 [Hyphomonadaceae bacterium]KAF0186961.1 MAG: hypothetical protein FD163_236 [Hyphomonadaceae bacterium]